MHNNNLLIFGLGALLGSLFTFLYMNEKHKEFVEGEIEFCDKITEEVKEEQDLEKKVLVMNKDRYKRIVTNYSKSEDIAMEYNSKPISTPYVISFESFCESNDHFDKITITYYAGDNVLVDEDEEVISDILGIIGHDALERFGEYKDDPDVVYVRNERMAIDYEIIRNEGRYSEIILGEREET